MTELATTNGSEVAAREHATLATFDPAALGLPVDFMEQMRFAEFVATSDLVPKALQGKAANCFLVIQKAIAMRLPWDVAMSGIHIIDNKVTCGAKLLRMLLRKAGHDYNPHTITDKEVRATLTLAHRPDKPIEVVYTIAEAQAAGLTSKAVWKNYVKAMLVAGNSRRAADWYAPEVAMGMDLSDETLAVTFGDTSPTVHATAAVERDDRRSIAVPAQRQAPEDAPAEPSAKPEMTPELAEALEILAKAREADDVSTLTNLGKSARAKKLLDQIVDVVDGVEQTLKQSLVILMKAIEERQGKPEPATAKQGDGEG